MGKGVRLAKPCLAAHERSVVCNVEAVAARRAAPALTGAPPPPSSAEMKRKLAAGVTLIVDRYAYSGVAFSAAKEGLDMHWCTQPDVGLPRPDAVLFLDLAVEESMKRGAFGEERYEKEEMQRKVRDNFLAMKEDDWHVVDATMTMDGVHEAVYAVAQAVIGRAADAGPVGELWKR